MENYIAIKLYKITYKEQYGCQKGKSAPIALGNFAEEVTMKFEIGKKVLV